MLDVTAEIFIGTLSSRDITTALTLQALWNALLLVNQPRFACRRTPVSDF